VVSEAPKVTIEQYQYKPAKIIIIKTKNSHLDTEDVSILLVKQTALGTLNKLNLHQNMKFYCVANNMAMVPIPRVCIP
jgi:hypothetical protein